MKKFKQNKNIFSKTKFLIENNAQSGAETFVPFGKSFIKKVLPEQGAQSGAVFRLMIDAIIGLVILAMILSTLSYFNYLKLQSSLDEFNLKVISAINSPNGRVIESNGNLFFLEGTGFTSIGMQELTAHPAECFSFQSRLGSVLIEGIQDRSAKIINNIETRVYFRCETASFAHGYCDIECVISFGTRLEDTSGLNSHSF